jgi:hypothetical protein
MIGRTLLLHDHLPHSGQRASGRALVFAAAPRLAP